MTSGWLRCNRSRNWTPKIMPMPASAGKAAQPATTPKRRQRETTATLCSSGVSAATMASALAEVDNWSRNLRACRGKGTATTDLSGSVALGRLLQQPRKKTLRQILGVGGPMPVEINSSGFSMPVSITGHGTRIQNPTTFRCLRSVSLVPWLPASS